MERAKERIDYARTHDFLHWTAKMVMGRCLETDWDAHPNKYLTNKSVLENAEKAVKEDAENKVLPNFHRNGYEEAKNGVVITSCNSRTLWKLKEMGLIEILRDSTGETYGIDKIKVLDY